MIWPFTKTQTKDYEDTPSEPRRRAAEESFDELSEATRRLSKAIEKHCGPCKPCDPKSKRKPNGIARKG